MTKLLTKKQILEADDLPFEIVEVKEWGGSVKIRTMTGTERDSFESSLLGEGGKKEKQKMMLDIRAKFASLVIVDEEGNRLFSAKDIKDLGKKSASCLDKILTVGQKLNGLTSEDIDELGNDSESILLENSSSD